MTVSNKIIVAFGHHDREAPRHWNIRKMLQSEGWQVIECHTQARGFVAKCRDLLAQWKKLRRGADTLLVTFPGHYLMPLAWLITRIPRRRLIFDAFISLHDSLVDDRKLVSRSHPRAWFLSLLDWVSCHLADEVWIDTEAHRQFFIKRFHLKPERIRVIYLGSREDLFKPANQPFDPTQGRRRNESTNKQHFEAFFYGTYIPLQGVDVILRAAKIVQEKAARVHFTLIGSGQQYKEMRKLAEDLELKNVTFHEFVPLKELAARLQEANLCLGIFGTTDKAARVIPHKVYDAVASGVPVITRDSPAIREKFASHPGVILCPAGDADALAEKILRYLDESVVSG